MKKIISILRIMALVLSLSISAMATDRSDVSVYGWSSHTISGTSGSVTKSCSYASVTANYADAFKSITASTGEYDSNNYKQSVSISFGSTKTRTITGYVSSGGGTIGIAS